MLKKELIWREILNSAFSQGILVFTQKALADQFKISLSTINNALKLPREAGAIKVTGRDFQIIDKEKFLLLWASHRRLNREIVYQTKTESSASQKEGLMPPSVTFAAYSAFMKKYQPAPADYDNVYVYADDKTLEEIKKRFPPCKGPANLVVLRADPFLKQYKGITPDAQTFADLWNLPQWYAKDFLEALKIKMGL